MLLLHVPSGALLIMHVLCLYLVTKTQCSGTKGVLRTTVPAHLPELDRLDSPVRYLLYL